MKTLIYKTLIFGAMFTLLVSCHKEEMPAPPDPECDSSNTPFQQLYASTFASNPAFDDDVTMDLVTHEYTFRLSAAMQICQIGYQSQPDLYANNIPIDIEIVEAGTTTVVYSGSHVFDAGQTDYVSIPPVSLSAGQDYTIRRKVVNHNGLMTNRIGRMLTFGGTTPYPVTVGVMTITGSDFYGVGGPVPDFGIPFIDIVLR